MSARSTFQSTILPITSVFAGIVTAFGVAMLAPLLLAFNARDPAQPAFLHSALLVFAPAVIVWLATRRFRRELRVRDGILLVTLIWTILPAIAAMPLLIGIPGLSFTDAYFESVSGLTTTGATVLSGLDQLPASLNLWRHLLHWFGGMGNIVLAVAILPLLGIGGMQLHRAETPGPMKDSKLTPRIAHTVKALWYVYAGLTLACALTLKLCGMSWFDAVCHAFSTLALGGFSTHDKSIGYFNSVPIELVLSFFQILAALNFATHFTVISQRALKPYLRDSEAVALLKALLLSVVGIAIFLQLKGTYPDFLVALRHASFNVITTATTGGFFSQDFNQWPLFAPMMMLFLSCIVASSGSTGGGLRMIRMLVLMKSAWREMLRILHPGLEHAGEDLRIRDREQGRDVGPGIRRRVLHEYRFADAAAAGVGTRPHQLDLRRDFLYQQLRARTWCHRPAVELWRAQRFSAVGVHRGNAARTSRSVYARAGVHSRLLEKVTEMRT